MTRKKASASSLPSPFRSTICTGGSWFPPWGAAYSAPPARISESRVLRAWYSAGSWGGAYRSSADAENMHPLSTRGSRPASSTCHRFFHLIFPITRRRSSQGVHLPYLNFIVYHKSPPFGTPRF